MGKKYYIAYGSNLNVPQMRVRCPGARYYGKAMLPGWQLLFKGSKSGNYLTIERKAGGVVPVVVWEITPEDEEALDFYEGFPTFYHKEIFNIRVKDKAGKRWKIEAFAYIMDESRKPGIPTNRYMETCIKGYIEFGFDTNILFDAYDRSLKA